MQSKHRTTESAKVVNNLERAPSWFDGAAKYGNLVGPFHLRGVENEPMNVYHTTAYVSQPRNRTSCATPKERSPKDVNSRTIFQFQGMKQKARAVARHEPFTATSSQRNANWETLTSSEWSTLNRISNDRQRRRLLDLQPKVGHEVSFYCQPPGAAQ